MLLTIDIGNTSIMLALFQDTDLREVWRLRTETAYTANDWWDQICSMNIDEPLTGQTDAIIISSVVPGVTAQIVTLCRNELQLEPLIVTATMPMGIKLLVTEPSTVGADRICNVVAAASQYDCPAVVVDLGTATAYDVIDAAGNFIGGAIAPGIETGARHLFEGGALLSPVNFVVPQKAVGVDTVSNLQSGILFGAIDQIDGMLARIQAEQNWSDPTFVITGGLGGIIAAHLKTAVRYDPYLTVKGLQLLHARSLKQSGS